MPGTADKFLLEDLGGDGLLPAQITFQFIQKPERVVPNEQPAYGVAARHSSDMSRFVHGTKMALRFHAGQSLHNRRFYRRVKKP